MMASSGNEKEEIKYRVPVELVRDPFGYMETTHPYYKSPMTEKVWRMGNVKPGGIMDNDAAQADRIKQQMEVEVPAFRRLEIPPIEEGTEDGKRMDEFRLSLNQEEAKKAEFHQEREKTEKFLVKSFYRDQKRAQELREQEERLRKQKEKELKFINKNFGLGKKKGAKERREKKEEHEAVSDPFYSWKDVRYIRVLDRETVPISAFGYTLPYIPKAPFELPPGFDKNRDHLFSSDEEGEADNNNNLS